MSNTENSRSNANTALYAYVASKALAGDMSGDDRENITDLIADLMHLVDSDPERFDGYDGEQIADDAMRNWFDEQDDDGQTEPDPEIVGAEKPTDDEELAIIHVGPDEY
jgi:hypothetical protein